MSRRLTCFGEINEPCSRAFWEDIDDDEDGIIPRPKKLVWSYSTSTMQSPISVDILLLIEGHNITDFAEQVLLKDTTELCKITNKKISLHKVNGKSTIIGVLEDNLSQSGEVASLLIPYSELAKNVITLTIQPKIEYKSENLSEVKDEITFIRAVTSGVAGIPELGAPNFIAGAAAGVSSYRQAKNLPVNTYIAYTDKLELDALSVAPILKLFQSSGITCAGKYEPKQRDASLLYM